MEINPEKSISNSFKHLDSSLINKNQLNTSISKMQYSFPKTERFGQTQQSFSPPRFYDIPTTKSKRAASIGYGNKIDLSKRNFVTPEPGRYTLQSQFKNDGKSGKTMGQGRNIVKANDMFYRSLKQCPDPGTYSPKKYQDSLKYSIHPKLEDQSLKWVKSVPGPGTYSYIQLTNPNGKSPLAKYNSIKATKFDKLPRLSEAQLSHNTNPGPLQYKNTAQILNRYKYKIKGGNTFSRGERLGIIDKKIKTPGPGNYNSFSQFA